MGTAEKKINDVKNLAYKIFQKVSYKVKDTETVQKKKSVKRHEGAIIIRLGNLKHSSHLEKLNSSKLCVYISLSLYIYLYII